MVVLLGGQLCIVQESFLEAWLTEPLQRSMECLSAKNTKGGFLFPVPDPDKHRVRAWWLRLLILEVTHVATGEADEASSVGAGSWD